MHFFCKKKALFLPFLTVKPVPTFFFKKKILDYAKQKKISIKKILRESRQTVFVQKLCVNRLNEKHVFFEMQKILTERRHTFFTLKKKSTYFFFRCAFSYRVLVFQKTCLFWPFSEKTRKTAFYKVCDAKLIFWSKNTFFHFFLPFCLQYL